MQIEDELLPEVLRDLLVEPPAGVVLADVEPDETPALEILPADLAVVGRAVALGVVLVLGAVI